MGGEERGGFEAALRCGIDSIQGLGQELGLERQCSLGEVLEYLAAKDAGLDHMEESLWTYYRRMKMPTSVTSACWLARFLPSSSLLSCYISHAI